MASTFVRKHATAARLSRLFIIVLLATGACRSFAADPPKPDHKVRIVLVGDSTVTDKSGWGLGFKEFLNDGAECINASSGGRSSKSFIDEGKWTNALALKGDYYLIQFGHNDEPGKGPERETSPDTTFTANMTRYVVEARAIGAKPVLITSLTRRQWDKADPAKIKSSLTPYAAAVKKIAADQKVPLIDLHARSIELCEKLGGDGCVKFSAVKVVDGTNMVDTTHLNEAGSVLFGGVVAGELRKAVPELAPLLRTQPREIPQKAASGD
jgi:pectinesterase